MSSVSGQLSDEQYLEQTEFPIFLRHLFMQAAVVRVSPEDCIDFAEKYFRRMQSCRNVLGADYLFITSCRQNRRAFVFCLLELFRSIPADHELTVAEFQQVSVRGGSKSWIFTLLEISSSLTFSLSFFPHPP